MAIPRTVSRTVALLVLIFAPQAAYAGAWTLEKGQVWSKITGLYQATDEHYDKDGEPSGIPADYTSQEVYLDVYYGVTKRFDLGVQFGAINRKFENFTSNRHREMFGYRAKESGLGDIRVFGKVNLVHEPVVGTLMLGIKAPTGDFRAAPEAMSAGNGQWDVEVVAQIGKSYWPIPIYANIDLGYRLRETNETIHHNPDDELIYNVEIGGSPVEMLNLALKLEGISGAGRRVTYAIPTAIVSLPQGIALEAAAQLGKASRVLAQSQQVEGVIGAGLMILRIQLQGTFLELGGLGKAILTRGDSAGDTEDLGGVGVEQQG